MDIEKRTNKHSNVIDFEIKKDAADKIKDLSPEQIKVLREKLEKRLGHVRGAIGEIDATRALRESSLLSTQRMMDSLKKSQDQFRNFYSPWTDLAKNFQPILPKLDSPWSSLAKKMSVYESPLFKSNLSSLGMGDSLNSYNETMFKAQTVLNSAHELRVPSYYAPPLLSDELPSKIEETTEAIDKMAQSLELHLKEEKLVSKEQLKLLQTLTTTAQMEMQGQEIQFLEGKKASEYSNFLVRRSITISVVALCVSAVGILATFVPYWFPKQEPIQLSQPVKVSFSGEEFAPMLNELRTMKLELKNLRGQLKKQKETR